MHNETSPETTKERVTIPQAWLSPTNHDECSYSDVSLERSWRRRFHGFQQSVRKSKKWWGQAQRHVVQQVTSTGWKVEKANCFNVWIQRSGRRFKLLPRKVVPEGLMSSCRADMSDTLAQNGHCELWSGRYRTCKKHLRHLKRLDKVSWRKSKFDVPVLGLAGCHSQAVIAKYST